jgi:hypothetical protein
MTTDKTHYLTVKQLSEKYPAFPQGGVRSWIFQDKNGFSKCLRRVGKKILISEPLFVQWLENQQVQTQ